LDSGQTWYGIPDCGLNNANASQCLPATVLVQIPLRYQLRAPLAMHPRRGLRERSITISDMALLGHGAYELKKGFSNRKLVNGGRVKLQLGGVVTGPPSQQLTEDTDM
jgi:hypothetical protein